MWFVTVGSNLFLVLWIAVYSFLPSIAFNEEIIVLFGTVDFWATIILSVTLAIGKLRILQLSIHRLILP